MNIKREHILLFCIVFIGVAVRIMKFGEPVVGTDVAAFTRLGKNLIEHGRYVFGENYNMGVFFPPGYPVFVGIVNYFLNDLFVSAKLVSLVSNCITIYIAYLIGNELYGKEAGLFAALFYAFYPVILIISLQGWSDSLFFCFLLLSIYIFIIAIKKDNFFIYPLLGFSIGISYLVRPEGMFLLLFPFLHLFGMFGERVHFNKKSLMRVSTVFVIFIIIVSPYVFFLKSYTGKVTLSGKSNISVLLAELSGSNDYHQIVNAQDNLYDRAAFQLDETKTQLVGWNRGANRSLREYILKDPVKVLKRYKANMARELKVLAKLLLPIIIPLFFVLFDRKIWKVKLNVVFIGLSLIYLILYPLFIIIEKQTLMIVIFVAFLSAQGFSVSGTSFSRILNYFSPGENKERIGLDKSIKAVIVVMLLLSSFVYLKYSSFDKSPVPIEHEIAGHYLKEAVSSDYEKLNVMSRKPLVSFYSGSRFTMLPYANSADVLQFAKLYNVDYIVIDERMLGKWDFYDELMEMHKDFQDVDLVFEDHSERLIRLFKIRKLI